jgi:hypothetical protein
MSPRAAAPAPSAEAGYHSGIRRILRVVPPRLVVRMAALAAAAALFLTVINALDLLAELRQYQRLQPVAGPAAGYATAASAALQQELTPQSPGGAPVPPQLLAAHRDFQRALQGLQALCQQVKNAAGAGQVSMDADDLAAAEHRWWVFRTTGRIVPNPLLNPGDAAVAAVLDSERIEAELGNPDPAGDGQYASSVAGQLPQEALAAPTEQAHEIRATARGIPRGCVAAVALTGVAWGLRRRRLKANSTLPVVAIASAYAIRVPRRPHRLARLIGAGVGWSLISAGEFAVVVGGHDNELALSTRAELFAPGLVAVLLGAWMWLRFRRGLGPSVPDLLALDGRPPVVYLRSFRDDTAAAEVVNDASATRQGVVPIQSHEQQLVTELRGVGPVIAVGRPGETLPPLGAARLYLRDQDWRSVVKRLIGMAALVVLRLGPGEGLWWELGVAVEELTPQQLLLLLPGPPDLSPITQRLDQRLPVPLPAETSAGRHRMDGWTAYVIAFGPGWQAQVEPDPTAAKKPGTAGVPESAGVFFRSLRRACRRAGLKKPRFSAGLRLGGGLVAPLLTSPIVLAVSLKIWSIIQGLGVRDPRQ